MLGRPLLLHAAIIDQTEGWLRITGVYFPWIAHKVTSLAFEK